MVLCKVRVGVSVRRIRSALNRCWKSWRILDFSDSNHLFIASFLALRLRLRHYSFIPVIKLNYRATFLWKILNIDWLCFPSNVYFFYLLIYDWWKWFILKMMKQEHFFSAQPWWLGLCKISLKFFPWIPKFCFLKLI